MSNLDVSRINDYGWIPKKKSKPRKKLFGEDDFKFFIFMSIFIFCLAGLVLTIAGAMNDNSWFFIFSELTFQVYI